MAYQDHGCWQKRFGSAVIARGPGIADRQHHPPCRGLELAAVEYPVLVHSGLVLMGYSTVLISIRGTNDDMILWHLETSLTISNPRLHTFKQHGNHGYRLEFGLFVVKESASGLVLLGRYSAGYRSIGPSCYMVRCTDETRLHGIGQA